MRLEPRQAWLLLGIAGWNVVTYAMFARNLAAAYLAGQDRAAGYWIAHTALIVVNFAIAGLLARLGVKALRSPG